MVPTILRNFWKSLAAVLLGNAVYFTVMAHLPPPARHTPFHVDPGLAVDAGFCLVAYWVIGLLGRHRSRGARGIR